MRKIGACVALVVLSIVPAAFADLEFTITEHPDLVVVSVSGSLDLSATLGFSGTASNTFSNLGPSNGIVSVGDPVFSDAYSVDVQNWTPFGMDTGGYSVSGNGDRVALFSNPSIGMPLGYVSGTPVVGTAVFPFPNIDITPGTYVTSFGTATASDTVTVIVRSIPEPAACNLLALAFITTCLRRKRLTKFGR